LQLATTSALIVDDAKLYFGTGSDAYIEYDEDGTDTWDFSPPAGGMKILDDKKLVFGTDSDASFEYDEDGADNLSIAGADVSIANGIGLIVGNTAQVAMGEVTSEVQILGTTETDACLAIGLASTTDALSPSLKFVKGAHATIGNHSVTVADNEELGKIQAYGSDATDSDTLSSEIAFNIDDDGVGTGTLGGEILLKTSGTDGTLDTAVTIDNSQNVGIGTTSPDHKLDVTDSNTVVAKFQGSGSAHEIEMGIEGGTFLAVGYHSGNYGYIQPTSLGLGAGMVITNAGNIGFGTTSPGQILDCNSGGGNMIADGYDTHSLAVYKENIEDASGYLDKVLACPAQKWNRKPFVSADEIKEAVLEEFGENVLIEEADEVEGKDAVYEKQYSVWDEHFPEDNSHRNKALYNMPEGDLKDWIDEWCEAKRVEMRSETKWQKKRLGLVADTEITAEHLPEVISINDEGEPTGIDTMTYIGVLHNAIQELSAKVEALENE